MRSHTYFIASFQVVGECVWTYGDAIIAHLEGRDRNIIHGIFCLSFAGCFQCHVHNLHSLKFWRRERSKKKNVRAKQWLFSLTFKKLRIKMVTGRYHYVKLLYFFVHGDLVNFQKSKHECTLTLLGFLHTHWVLAVFYTLSATRIGDYSDSRGLYTPFTPRQ